MPEEISPRKAIEQVEAIVAALRERWDDLPPEGQRQAEELYQRMRREYGEAQAFQRGAIVARFLHELEGIPGVREAVGDLIDATRGPAIRAVVMGDLALLDRLPARLTPAARSGGPTRRYLHVDVSGAETPVELNQPTRVVVRVSDEPLGPDDVPFEVDDEPTAELILDPEEAEIEGEGRREIDLGEVVEAWFTVRPQKPGLRSIVAELRRRGQAWARAERHMTVVEPPRRGLRPSDVPRMEESVAPAPEKAVGMAPEPATLTRYPHLDAPARVALNDRFSVFVQLLIEPPTPEAEAVQIADTGEPEHPPEVEVVLRARGFDVEGGNTRVITVARDEDTEERFVLIAREPGDHTIRADFYQFGRRIGSVSCQISVGAAEPTAERAPVEIPGGMELRVEPALEPPDLELCIELGPDGRTLSFELYSWRRDLNYHRKPAGQVTLQDSPLEKTQAVYQELSQMARRKPPTETAQALAERRLAAAGNDLWDELIPADLQREYWRFRDRVRTLLITCDEPWLPWEMIKPYRYSDDGQREDDEFWCQRFAISRWLPGPGLADALQGGAVRPVAPEQVNLAAVQEEVQLVSGLPSLCPVLESRPPLHRVLDVVTTIEQEPLSLMHFACHGQFDATLPNDSAITLSDGNLRPSDIQARFGGRRPRPLIFINACHGARMEFSFTGLGGWADRLIRRANAAAFLGAMWEVNDQLALKFARRFYQALLVDRVEIAEAVRLAREAIREAEPYNSTWLAYVLYADPKVRIVA